MYVRLSSDRTRVLVCALVVGFLFAVLAGLDARHSLSSDETDTSARTEIGFAPVAALVGFVAGALIGTLSGILWTRPGMVGWVGMAAVTAAGGLAGLTVAALAGAETRTAVVGNSVSMDYGASAGVLAAGAAVGTVVGALAAWRFRTRPATLGPTT